MPLGDGLGCSGSTWRRGGGSLWRWGWRAPGFPWRWGLWGPGFPKWRPWLCFVVPMSYVPMPRHSGVLWLVLGCYFPYPHVPVPCHHAGTVRWPWLLLGCPWLCFGVPCPHAGTTGFYSCFGVPCPMSPCPPGTVGCSGSVLGSLRLCFVMPPRHSGLLWMGLGCCGWLWGAISRVPQAQRAAVSSGAGTG